MFQWSPRVELKFNAIHTTPFVNTWSPPKDTIKKKEHCHTVHEHSYKICAVSIKETKSSLGARSGEHKRNHPLSQFMPEPLDKTSSLIKLEFLIKMILGLAEVCEKPVTSKSRRASSTEMAGGVHHLAHLQFYCVIPFWWQWLRTTLTAPLGVSIGADGICPVESVQLLNLFSYIAIVYLVGPIQGLYMYNGIHHPWDD